MAPRCQRRSLSLVGAMSSWNGTGRDGIYACFEKKEIIRKFFVGSLVVVSTGAKKNKNDYTHIFINDKI